MAKTTTPESSFDLGHQFKSREARDHFSGLLDEAEKGGVAVVRRDLPFVVVRRDLYDDVLAGRAPFDVRSSVHGSQVSFWLDSVPIHAIGNGLDEAEDEFLGALIDYAELWLSELRHAPNHRTNAPLVQRIVMYAGDRDELRRVVFGD
jgi:hypothetical protein